MSYQTNIQVLDKGQILAECGPMRLIIGAWQGQVPQREFCIQAAKHSFGLLERLPNSAASCPGIIKAFLKMQMIFYR